MRDTPKRKLECSYPRLRVSRRDDVHGLHVICIRHWALDADRERHRIAVFCDLGHIEKHLAVNRLRISQDLFDCFFPVRLRVLRQARMRRKRRGRRRYPSDEGPPIKRCCLLSHASRCTPGRAANTIASATQLS